MFLARSAHQDRPESTTRSRQTATSKATRSSTNLELLTWTFSLQPRSLKTKFVRRQLVRTFITFYYNSVLSWKNVRSRKIICKLHNLKPSFWVEISIGHLIAKFNWKKSPVFIPHPRHLWIKKKKKKVRSELSLLGI